MNANIETVTVTQDLPPTLEQLALADAGEGEAPVYSQTAEDTGEEDQVVIV